MSSTKARPRRNSTPPAVAKKAKLSNLLKLEATVGIPLGTIQERAAAGFFEAHVQLLWAVVLSDEPELTLEQFIQRADEVGLDAILESVGVEL